MRNQYIEKDGLLFMKCEPELLEKGTKMPCLVRLITDNSRIGRINKSFDHNLHKLFICDRITSKTNDRYCDHGMVMSGENILAHYCYYEVVGKHCPEGSVEWALWQMLNGKIVVQTNKYKTCYTIKYKVCDNDVYCQGSSGSWIGYSLAESWLTIAEPFGWEIYEEPKPEVSPKLEVGKWYKHKDEYMLCEQVFQDYARFSKCGISEYVWLDGKHHNRLVPTSLEPDFSSAKAGDECYSSAGGVCIIAYVDMKDKPEIMVNCSGRNGYYHVNGKYATIDIHPTLFHSLDHFIAYFAEVARKERESK